MDLALHEGGPRFGKPGWHAPRLGQKAFAAVVSAAYAHRCSLTGAKIRPVLQAAHIRPYAHEGEHRVDNGLLLRADVHIMFDQGFLGVHPAGRTLQVSSSLRDVYGNGEEFYARAGSPIALPARKADQPNAEFLAWHMDVKFRS